MPCACCGRCGGRDVRRAAGARRAVCVGVLRARVHAAPRRAAGAGACRASAWDVPLPCCVPQALRARAACAGVPRAAGAASACRATTCDGLACRVRGRTAPLGAGCARGQHVEGVADGGPFRFPRRAHRGGVRLRGSFLWSSCRSGGATPTAPPLARAIPRRAAPVRPIPEWRPGGALDLVGEGPLRRGGSGSEREASKGAGAPGSARSRPRVPCRGRAVSGARRWGRVRRGASGWAGRFKGARGRRFLRKSGVRMHRNRRSEALGTRKGARKFSPPGQTR